MYDAKSSKGLGLLISRDGSFIQLDWCLVDRPWEPDPRLDKLLEDGGLFRSVSEKFVDSFYFRSDTV
jgi:hypothetical protein